jgi:pyridoxine 5-phosphate synthase
MLSVNIDHVATLRQARRAEFPDPVQLALLVESGGADGVTVHLRRDRRHINERDVGLLRQTAKGELTVEMAATREMADLASKFKPDQVTLVPELRAEVTTTGGLDLSRHSAGIRPIVRRLKRVGIRLSIFVEPDAAQVAAAAKLGADVVELNTDAYCRDRRARAGELARLVAAATAASESGLAVHVGHGLNYKNVIPIVESGLAEGYSIGFAIIARSLVTGMRQAVADMKHILEVYS